MDTRLLQVNLSRHPVTVIGPSSTGPDRETREDLLAFSELQRGNRYGDEIERPRRAKND